MNKRLLFIACYLLLVTCLFTGCAKKKIVKPQQPIEPPQQVVEEPQEEPSLREKEYKRIVELETVYFDYNNAALHHDARNILAKNVKYLKKNVDVEVVVEGHCDERGTTDYNIALGDRRAKSIRSYMVKLGVKGNRIATISYGEEKPANSGNNEASWAKNRRGEILGRILPATASTTTSTTTQ
ncbi:MAG: peptidoglycan-associated lipoprotein Pal [Elusimicrobiota bacterium]